jgi:2-polyprenyl-3-methyl-5-hydroxy-6-metoxy-1,4-benzoquinol methylase
MSEGQDQYWKQHYDKLAINAKPWLDYSNDRVQAQTLALAIESAGSIQGRRCLDFGCGFGLLSMALVALGAASVCGVDQSSVMIERNRLQNTTTNWIVGQVCDIPRESTYDLVFAIEVLQYLPLEDTLKGLWANVAPGGRLVAVVPNRDCPLVQFATERFDAKYWAPTAEELSAGGAALPDLAYLMMRGLQFAADQTIVPYGVTEWTSTASLDCVPNRLIIVAGKLPPG